MLVPVTVTYDAEKNSFSCRYPEELKSSAMTKKLSEATEAILEASPSYQVDGLTAVIQVEVEENYGSFTVEL